MTVQEATKKHIAECRERILRIKRFAKTNKDADVKGCEENVFVLKNAMESLKELQQYRALGTVEELKEAKEKQIPKKPKEYEDRYYACECGNILLPKWKEYPTKLMPKSEGLPYCMACGQALKWGEEDD